MLGLLRLQVGGGGLLHGDEGQPGGASLQARDHAKVRIFFPVELPSFNGRADDAQRAHPGVAHVGKNDLLRASGRNHLIVDQIGGGAGQGKIFSLLADDLVPGSEGDQVGEPGTVNQVSIPDVFLDGFF